jgi:hypothetical protein
MTIILSDDASRLQVDRIHGGWQAAIGRRGSNAIWSSARSPARIASVRIGTTRRSGLRG